MSKSKAQRGVFSVLGEAIGIYFSNIDKFFVYMLFPVFGQVIGILLTFGLTLGFADKVIEKTNSTSSAILSLLLLAIPGVLIFAKAFWDFMVAYVALNSMTEGAVSTGHVYDFKSHKEVATRRAFNYILLLLAVSILVSVSSTIFFIIPGFVLWIYFILVFQVFTFEPELTVPECFKQSFLLIKGNWGKTFFIMLILAFFSIFIITQGITVIFDYLNLSGTICSLFDFIGKSLPLDYINKALLYLKLPTLTVNKISGWIFTSILGFLVAGMTLPIRSICWSLWYKNLSDAKTSENKEYRKKQRTATKRERIEE